MMFIIAVNSTLCGLLAAAIGGVAGLGALVTVGTIVCLGYVTGSSWLGGRGFLNFWRTYVPLHPSTGNGSGGPH